MTLKSESLYFRDTNLCKLGRGIMQLQIHWMSHGEAFWDKVQGRSAEHMCKRTSKHVLRVKSQDL